jgi:hypothetical protein
VAATSPSFTPFVRALRWLASLAGGLLATGGAKAIDLPSSAPKRSCTSTTAAA